MNDPISPISADEVDQIARLVETLEDSSFDYLQVQVGDMKVTLAKDVLPAEVPPTSVPVMPPPMTAPPTVSIPAAPPPTSPGASSEAPTAAPVVAASDDGTLEIRAPMMGRYYAQSQPGDPPFVTVGSEVAEDTTVGLIEVMKTFTTVHAGLRGVVTQVLIKNDDYVEYGQPLMKVRPA